MKTKFLIFLLLLLSTSYTFGQTKLDNYLTHRQPEFTILAPDSNELQYGIAQLDKAAKTFKKYFPKNIESVSFLLTPDPDALDQNEIKQIRSRYDNLKIFFTQNALSKVQNTAETIYALNSGILLREGNQIVSVIALLPGNTVVDQNIKTGDQLLAINNNNVSRIYEIRSMYEKISIGDEFTLKLKRKDSVIKINVLKISADALPNISFRPTSQGSNEINKTTSDKNPLSHEVCHALFVQHVERVYPYTVSQNNDSYGSDIIPDWLDEGIATLCENDALKNSRYSYFNKNFSNKYSLNELLNMSHPLAHLVTDQESTQNGTFKVMRVESGDNIKTRLAIYYSQVLSFTEYLVSTYGSKILSDITEFYATQKTDFDLYLKENSCLPNSIKELEVEWLEWIDRKWLD